MNLKILRNQIETKLAYNKGQEKSYSNKYLNSGKLADRIQAITYRERSNTLEEILGVIKRKK